MKEKIKGGSHFGIFGSMPLENRPLGDKITQVIHQNSMAFNLIGFLQLRRGNTQISNRIKPY